MTRRQLPFFAAFIVLLFGAMACACLGSGIGVGGFQATANAVLTQASGTAAAAGTSAVATANAAGGNTTGAATPTTASSGAQPTAVATTASGGAGGGTAPGGPSDIPLVDAQNTIQAATAQALVYTTSADVATVTAFYKDAMPKNGWTQNTAQSVEAAGTSSLTFTKDNRTAVVVIASTGGVTAVEVGIR